MSSEPRILDPSKPHVVGWFAGREVPLVMGARQAVRCLELLGEEVAAGSFRVLGFCLLHDAIELVLDDFDSRPSIPLGRLASRYARSVNRWSERAGPLARSRYASWPLDSARDVALALRGVARAPVRAGRTRRPETWPWSSHHAFLGVDTWPWLPALEVLRELFHPVASEARRRYAAWIEDPDPTLLSGSRSEGHARRATGSQAGTAGYPGAPARADASGHADAPCHADAPDHADALDQAALPSQTRVPGTPGDQPLVEDRGSAGKALPELAEMLNDRHRLVARVHSAIAALPAAAPSAASARRRPRLRALDGLSPHRAPADAESDLSRILAQVASVYRIPVAELDRRDRRRWHSEARAVAAHLVLERGAGALPDLVRCLRRGAPAVSQAVSRLRARLRTENALAERMNALRHELDRLGVGGGHFTWAVPPEAPDRGFGWDGDRD